MSISKPRQSAIWRRSLLVISFASLVAATSCAKPPPPTECGIPYPNDDARAEMTRDGEGVDHLGRRMMELEERFPETYDWIRGILRDCGWIT